MIRKITAVLLSAVILCAQPFPVCAASEDVFYEDFSAAELDVGKWMIAQRNWGGTVNENGKNVDYNGGVISDNVSVSDGELILTGHGNLYEGDICGINRDGTRRSDGKRCGGAIATREYFGSGSYEIRAKISPELGCCSALWTFEYEEEDSDGELKITNHEIDIEFPGRDENNDYSLSHALCTTWVTEEDYKSKSVFCTDQADGKYHTYRFDWHTGSDTETPRVDYYFDDELIYTSHEYIPTNKSRFWLGLWFPKGWAGTPDFDTTEFKIDYVKITPFNESGDTPQHESYSGHGWDEPDAEIPKGWLLWHSYSKYSALDSTLYLRSPEGEIKEITGDFFHAMNGSFGLTPDSFTFMAIDKSEEIWDIYLYDKGKITDLTKDSGYRNEDPKFSPDGKSIVFKRSQWDPDLERLVYNIALMDVKTQKVTMLTDDLNEEAMPCFSSDGKYIYYASYTEDIGSIIRMDAKTHKTTTIFSESGVSAYYPVTKGDKLYFSKWYDAENQCNQLMCYDGKDITSMKFNCEEYNCSDACPVSDTAMIYSCTAGGNYDLYYFDGTRAARIGKINSDLNELGADLYSMEEYEKYTGTNENKDSKSSTASKPESSKAAESSTSSKSDSSKSEESSTDSKPQHGPRSVELGDVNADGQINVTDISMTAAHIKGIRALTEDEIDRADVNIDKQVNVSDISMIAAHIKGIKPIGQ